MHMRSAAPSGGRKANKLSTHFEDEWNNLSFRSVRSSSLWSMEW